MFRASPACSQIDPFSNVEQFLRGVDQKKLNYQAKQAELIA